MARLAKYDCGQASSCFIHITKDGSAEAGMVLQDGSLLVVELGANETAAEVSKETGHPEHKHMIGLVREGENLVRRSSYMGLLPVVEEEFDSSIPRGKDYWLGGTKRYR